MNKVKIGDAGEHHILSELLIRDFEAYSARKNNPIFDIAVIINGIRKKIEVKTTLKTSWPTKIFWKYPKNAQNYPDFWILVSVDKNNIFHNYILTHDELANVKMKKDNLSSYPTQPTGKFGTVNIKDVQQYEDCWDKLNIL